MAHTAPRPILLVEDNPDHVLLTRIALKHAGIRNPPVELSDGTAAVSFLAGEPPYDDRDQHPRPALVLLDLEMPEMSGDEVLAWMRSDERPTWIRKLPVVVVTGIEYPERLDRVRQLGANAVVGKSPDPSEFAGRLRRACEEWLPRLRRDKENGPKGRPEAS